MKDGKKNRIWLWFLSMAANFISGSSRPRPNADWCGSYPRNGAPPNFIKGQTRSSGKWKRRRVCKTLHIFNRFLQKHRKLTAQDWQGQLKKRAALFDFSAFLWVSSPAHATFMCKKLYIGTNVYIFNVCVCVCVFVSCLIRSFFSWPSSMS